jgi:hypothetical protein
MNNKQLIVDEMWEKHWDRWRRHLALHGHAAAQWQNIFRGHYYYAGIEILRSVRDLAEVCNRQHYSLEAFMEHIALLQGDLADSRREWHRKRDAARRIGPPRPWWSRFRDSILGVQRGNR